MAGVATDVAPVGNETSMLQKVFTYFKFLSNSDLETQNICIISGNELSSVSSALQDHWNN